MVDLLLGAPTSDISSDFVPNWRGRMLIKSVQSFQEVSKMINLQMGASNAEVFASSVQIFQKFSVMWRFLRFPTSVQNVRKF